MSNPKQIQIGWVVRALDGHLMFWALDELAEASTYCEDDAQPVPIWADQSELKKHDDAQEDS